MTEHSLPMRKRNRMQGYDYSACGLYFITLCTMDRECLLWDNVGAICDRPPKMLPLSAAGKAIEAERAVLSTIYENVQLELCCIMPNHVHLLLHIHPGTDGRSKIATTISRVIKQFKGAVSKWLGQPIWQRSFYDHVIRNEQEYIRISEYVENNPANLALDQLYRKEISCRGDL